MISLYDSSYIKNLKIHNIYFAGSGSTSAVFISSNYLSYAVRDCKISGIIVSGSLWSSLYRTGEPYRKAQRCSIDLLLKGTSTIFKESTRSLMTDCYVKIKAENTADLFAYTSTGSKLTGQNSYFEIDAPHFYENTTLNRAAFDNCVFEVTSDAAFTFDINSSVSPSIINTTKAPNCTPQNKILGVTDENWLDVEYLSGIGFNAG